MFIVEHKSHSLPVGYRRTAHCVHVLHVQVRRLTNCGGSEAAWVVAMPTRPQFCMTNAQWRDAFAFRLALPVPSLMTGIELCDCHERFQRRTGEIARDAGSRRGRRGSRTPRRRRRRKPPKPVDEEGEHDQVCK
eukprot:COSAG01_NODE_18535_length_1069_cov_5.876289_1_plen_133_part_01